MLIGVNPEEKARVAVFSAMTGGDGVPLCGSSQPSNTKRKGTTPSKGFFFLRKRQFELMRKKIWPLSE